ncbi:MAG: hypothetical protein M0033_04490 [Nitrospiraceae bacterium]|nr:hypothetical protein [Nitrospiraceae bacterium]
MERIDPESHQIREVYARYGLAMYHAQCVERQIALLLSTEYGPGSKKITRAQYDGLLQSHFKRTLGALLCKLEKSTSLPTDFEKTLRAALEKRNWLAHKYFWERAGHFVSDKGRAKMIMELQEASDHFERLDAKLTEVTESWARRNNVTSKDLQEALERVIANADEAN